MISTVREICIFMIIAQTILYFAPGDSYMKYVRVLVGIMMIMKITEPVFGFFLDEGQQQEMKSRVLQLQEALKEGKGELELPEDYGEIYEEVEGELKKRLEGCDDGYHIVSVNLAQGQEGGEKIVIALSEKNAGDDGNIWIAPVKLGEESDGSTKEKDRLKELYGGCMGVDAGRIEIVFK